MENVHAADVDVATKALEVAVQNTDTESQDVQLGIHSHPDGVTSPEEVVEGSGGGGIGGEGGGGGKHHAWLMKLVPGIEKLAVKMHAGNFVAIRNRSKPPGSDKIFESMPIYARVGMHLLFYGKEQVKLLEAGKIESVLREQTLKQGRIYDSPDSKHSIPSFIKTYSIDTSELLQSNVSEYANFNEFFYRKLKPDARPVENPVPESICSAADCRLTVYQTVEEAQKFWIKGDEFTLKNLIYGPNGEYSNPEFPIQDASLAIFRLAPADYHRFHSPIDATVIEEPKTINGTYYTVNPQAVNEINFDVFTANKRETIFLKHEQTGQLIAFVAIGALLVGSIGWTKKAGEKVAKGEELGYFAYGGSTVITVFPPGLIKFDEDLMENSRKTLETLVKVGHSLGVSR